MKKQTMNGYIIMTEAGYVHSVDKNNVPEHVADMVNAWVYDWIYDAEQIAKLLKEVKTVSVIGVKASIKTDDIVININPKKMSWLDYAKSNIDIKTLIKEEIKTYKKHKNLK